MRKVLLSMEAQEKYEIIKRMAEGHITKNTAAVKIGCTVRHIGRLLTTYKQKGKSGFLHGNTGRKPAHALTDLQKTEIVTLYNNKYWDANFTHCVSSLRFMIPFASHPPAFEKSFTTNSFFRQRLQDAHVST